MNNMKNNMKSLIVLILMAALLPHAAIAQTGLHSDAVFKGQVVPQNAMVEVKVRGRTLSRYRLTFYHSVRFNATAQQKASINNLVERDAKQAVSTETRKQGGRRSSSSVCLPTDRCAVISVISPADTETRMPSPSSIWKGKWKASMNSEN